MESNSVSYIYSRYKSGTKEVVNWIVETARRRLDISKEISIPESGARITAHHNTGKKARGKREKSEAKALHISISSADLLRLSSKIAAFAAPPADAPTGLEAVISILEDVIRGRQECALWHAHRGDQGHRHFLDTLKQVLRHLKSAVPKNHDKREKASAISSNARSADHASDIISNAFAALAVEQPTSHALGASSPTLAGDVKDKLPSQTSFQLESNAEEEKLFAAWCLFKECKAIRTAACAAWQDYLSGQCALQDGAQITFAAKDLIQSACERFCEDFRELASFDSLAQSLDLRTTIRNGSVEHFSCVSPTLSVGNQQTEAMMDVLCVKAYIGALLVRSLAQSRCMTPIDGEKIAELERHIDSFHEVLHAHQKYGNALAEIPKKLGQKSLDLFSHNFNALSRVNELDLYYVIILQLEMDISDTIGTARSSVFKSLDVLNQKLKLSLEDMETFRLDKEIVISHLPIDIPRIHRFVDATYTKGAELDGTEQSMSTGHVLSRFPVTAAMLAPAIGTMWHIDAVNFANMECRLPPLIHLYRALLSAGLIATQWKDLELVIDAHGEHHLGLRDNGTSQPLLAAAKNFSIACGVHAHEYAKNRRENEKDPRVPLPVIGVTKKGTLSNVKLPALRHRSRITECLWKLSSAAYSIGQTMNGTIQQNLHRYVEALLEDPDSAIDPSILDQWKTSRQLTPVQLLTLMQQSLRKSELATNFDYMHLFRSCWDVYSDLLEDVLGPVDRSRRVNHRKPSRLAIDVVDELLWGAALEKLNGWRDPNLCGLRHLKGFGKSLQAWIEKNGDTCYKNALQYTSGHLRDEWIPDKNREETPKKEVPGWIVLLEKDQLGLGELVEFDYDELDKFAIETAHALGCSPSEAKQKLIESMISGNPVVLGMSRE